LSAKLDSTCEVKLLLVLVVTDLSGVRLLLERGIGVKGVTR
jgi:hypothetical protein